MPIYEDKSFKDYVNSLPAATDVSSTDIVSKEKTSGDVVKVDGNGVAKAGEVVIRSPGKNLYDAGQATGGAYIDSAGNVTTTSSTSPNYLLSYYIKVTAGTYHASAKNDAALGASAARHGIYDSSLNLISLSQADSTDIEVPENGAFVRLSVVKTREDVMLERGQSRTDYEEYNPIGSYGIDELRRVSADIDADVKNVESRLSDNVSAIDLNDKSIWNVGQISSNTGMPIPSTTRMYSDMMLLDSESVLSFSMQQGVSGGFRFYFYDVSGNYISNRTEKSVAKIKADNPLAKFFRVASGDIAGVTVSVDNLDDIVTFGEGVFVKDYATPGEVKALDDKIDGVLADGREPIDLNDPSVWYLGGVSSTTGEPTSSSDRLSTRLMRLADDTSFSFVKAGNVTTITRALYIYDSNKVFLGMLGTSVSDVNIPTVKAMPEYSDAVWYRWGFLKLQGEGVVISVDNISNLFRFSGSYAEVTDGIATRLTAVEDKLSTIGVSGNILAGKVWYACGDSFTEGTTADIDKIPDGPYKGKNGVYPYWIGGRNGMTVENIAVSGSTLAMDAGSTERNCFSYPRTGRYLSIPADVDYITLKFGINDSHHEIPIGDVTDEVNTTFCGAWNIVLREIITNHPFAHIGIIVTNGCDESNNNAYTDATIAMARRWGIPYLDENGSDQVPLLHRVNGRPYLCDEVRRFRMNQFRISDTNAHPNAQAHLWESYFVEHWLRSL